MNRRLNGAGVPHSPKTSSARIAPVDPHRDAAANLRGTAGPASPTYLPPGRWRPPPDSNLMPGGPAQQGTLEEAIRVTGILKSKQERADVLERSRRVLDLAVTHGTTVLRAHPDVDLIQGLIGVETLLELKEEYLPLIDIQIVAFPQEGILKSAGTYELMEADFTMGRMWSGDAPTAK